MIDKKEISEEELTEVLSSTLDEEDLEKLIEADLMSYLAGMLTELDIDDEDSSIEESMGPFLESVGISESGVEDACKKVAEIIQMSNGNDNNNGGRKNAEEADGPVRLKTLVSMSSELGQSDADTDANRYLWGVDNKVSAMTNKVKDAHQGTVSAKDRRKARQELERARREYEAKVAAMEDEEKRTTVKAGVSCMVLPDYSSGRNDRDIQVHNVGLSLDNGRALLDNATIKFAYQRRYGLVGKNGIGKTTLLKAIASLEIPDFPKHHRILHVRQEIAPHGSDITVLQAVMDSDVELNTLLQREKAITAKLEKLQPTDNGDKSSISSKQKLLKDMQISEQDSEFAKDLKELDDIYSRLSQIEADKAQAKAATILSGLQFTPEMQHNPTSKLSGGWRMRVSLAAALFIQPDLLLLDEPTNHLDLEAVLWLQNYLLQYKHTLVVVSHDRSFLNEVCTDIIQFHNNQLTYYRGNYDNFIKTSEENVRNTMRVYQAYQDKRAHIMEFIEKFRCNAKRATLVQSRIKTVEKMDAEAPQAPPAIDPLWRFSVPNPEPISRPIISIDDATFDYKPGDKAGVAEYLLQKVNFGIDLDSRIGILGPNGAGKSTLLNLIMDKLNPVQGSVSRNPRVRIYHFTQHSADNFDLQLSAMENMLAIFPDSNDQEVRSFLGKFQIQANDAIKPMLMLSGGQKSRVAFAVLSYSKPHVIVMDEPTNHLDMESIDALVEAIKDFKGGLVVVSHDQYFITQTCQDIWVVGEGKATQFRGDFYDYKKHTLTKTEKRVAESLKSLAMIAN